VIEQVSHRLWLRGRIQRHRVGAGDDRDVVDLGQGGQAGCGHRGVVGVGGLALQCGGVGRGVATCAAQKLR